MRNQSIAGSTLPDLSEAAEQEKGESFFSRRRFLSAFCQGWALPGTLGKELFHSKNDDDLFLCFCSSMPPISWPCLNRELIQFLSADSSVVKVEPKLKTPELELDNN